MAASAHHSVGKGCLASLTVLLLNCVLISVTCLFQVVEDILRDLGLLRSGRASELVEVTVEPLVDLLVEGVVVVTDLLGGLALLAGFGLRGGSVLVGTTNIDDVVSSEAGEASVDISRQDTSDNVAKMGHVVDVG